MQYILDENNEVKEESDIDKWVNWITKNRNTYRKISKMPEGLLVTRFLGHNVGTMDEPVFFQTESLDNGGSSLEILGNYKTWADAKRGHERILGDENVN